MATFLRQSDCAGEHHANPNRLRDPDAISRSVKSNKIFITPSDPVGKGSHVKVHFIFKSDKNYYGKWVFCLTVKQARTSPYLLLGCAKTYIVANVLGLP
jgi:hypothetical protein